MKKAKKKPQTGRRPEKNKTPGYGKTSEPGQKPVSGRNPKLDQKPELDQKPDLDQKLGFIQKPEPGPIPEPGEKTDTKKKRRNRIWTILFILINIGVIAWAAIHEFAGKPPGAINLRFTKEAVFFLACTAGCLAVVLCAEALK